MLHRVVISEGNPTTGVGYICESITANGRKENKTERGREGAREGYVDDKSAG